MVRLSVAYAAALCTAITIPLSPLLIGTATAGTVVLARWQPAMGVYGAAFTLGAWVGGWHRRRAATTCRFVWSAGSKTATLLVLYRPGPPGVTDARIIEARPRCTGVVRVRFPPMDLAAGTRVVAVGTYRPGVFSARRVRVLGRARGWRLSTRDAVAQRIRGLYGARAGLVEALVLGRRHDIDFELRRTFTAAGLAHLLAISGLHVGILAGWFLLAARLAGAGRHAWLWSAVLTWFYVAVLGFTAPATRAAAFVSLWGVARSRQRHPPFAGVLAAAAFVLLLVDPLAVKSVGAWLSMAAVWGTHRAGRMLRGRARALPPVRLAAASVGATVTTAPITAFAFGSVAPVGVLANLVAVPLASVAVPGVFASLALGPLVAGGAGLALGAIEWVASLAVRLPGGHLTGPASPLFALPWAALLLVAWWLTTDRAPRRVVTLRALAVAAATSWILLATWAWPRNRHAGQLLVHVLDVGQGDAIALRTPHGRWVLIDAGPAGRGMDAGRRVVLPFLRRHGGRSLAALVISHADADHLGGGPSVTRALEPEMVLEPGQPLGGALYLEHLATVDSLGLAWQAARAGDTLVVDGVTLAVLHPATDWIDRQIAPNENSVVLHVSFGCFDAILAGDAGAPSESEILAGWSPAGRTIELLKVGHHGSRTGTTAAWLESLEPRIAVISVGKNRYGHPSREVLHRLARRHIPIYRTDRGGTVTIRTDGRYLVVRQRAPLTLVETIWCRLRPSLPSSDSSWSRSGCTQPPRVSSPICSTTSPSPPRSSLDTSAGPVSWMSSAPPVAKTSRANNSKSWTSSPTRP